MSGSRDMRMMDALGYAYEWLAFRFLSREVLAEQYAALRSGGDQNTEHYRFASFQTVIDRLAALDRDDFEQLLLLVASDPDPGMAKAALHLIASSAQLRPWQEAILGRSGVLGKLGEAAWFRRNALRRSIAADGPTEENCRLALESNDGRAQEAILASGGAPRRFVERLVECGANQKVRKAARRLLKREGLGRRPGDLHGPR